MTITPHALQLATQLASAASHLASSTTGDAQTQAKVISQMADQLQTIITRMFNHPSLSGVTDDLAEEGEVIPDF